MCKFENFHARLAVQWLFRGNFSLGRIVPQWCRQHAAWNTTGKIFFLFFFFPLWRLMLFLVSWPRLSRQNGGRCLDMRSRPSFHSHATLNHLQSHTSLLLIPILAKKPQKKNNHRYKTSESSRRQASSPYVATFSADHVFGYCFLFSLSHILDIITMYAPSKPNPISSGIPNSMTSRHSAT